MVERSGREGHKFGTCHGQTGQLIERTGRAHDDERGSRDTSDGYDWVERHGISSKAHANLRRLAQGRADAHAVMALGASTCVIRSSSQVPSTVKCAVAPSSTASI